MPTSSEAVLASSETRKAKIFIHRIKTLRFNKHLPFVFIHLPAACHNSRRGRTHSLGPGSAGLWDLKSGPRTEQGCRPSTQEGTSPTQAPLSRTGESEARDLSWP